MSRRDLSDSDAVARSYFQESRKPNRKTVNRTIWNRNRVELGVKWNRIEPEPERTGTGTNWILTITLGPGNSIFARFEPFGTRIRL